MIEIIVVVEMKINLYLLLYYAKGGRDKSINEFKQIENNWQKYIIEWDKQIIELRLKYNVLTLYTVNEIRWLIKQNYVLLIQLFHYNNVLIILQ